MLGNARITTILFILTGLLFFSCEDQIPSVSLNESSGSSLAYKDEDRSFLGSTSGPVETVEFFIGGESVETVIVNDGSFKMNHIFTDLGDTNLVIKALGVDGSVLAEAKYALTVVERSVSDGSMFDFSFPKYRGGSSSRSLWATYYYLPQVTNVTNGYPLRDLKGNRLGPVLSEKNWCFAAMEGSVRVIGNDGVGVTYNYAGTADGNTVNCSRYFSWNVSRTKFKIARGEYGDGVRRYKLVPYRTIAVDRTRIPYGSIVYIPSARGNEITLPDGSKTVHDGYFFAGDTGGAIKGTHIDVYIGVAKSNPFSWVKSRESGTFKAYVVNDSQIAAKLTQLHVD